jgi:hypothetical protein
VSNKIIGAKATSTKRSRSLNHMSHDLGTLTFCSLLGLGFGLGKGLGLRFGLGLE